MNQSQLVASTATWDMASSAGKVAIGFGFGFASHWLRKWREFVDQSENTIKETKANVLSSVESNFAFII